MGWPDIGARIRGEEVEQHMIPSTGFALVVLVHRQPRQMPAKKNSGRVSSKPNRRSDLGRQVVMLLSNKAPVLSERYERESDRYFAANLDDLVWRQSQMLCDLHAVSLHRGI